MWRIVTLAKCLLYASCMSLWPQVAQSSPLIVGPSNVINSSTTTPALNATDGSVVGDFMLSGSGSWEYHLAEDTFRVTAVPHHMARGTFRTLIPAVAEFRRQLLEARGISAATDPIPDDEVEIWSQPPLPFGIMIRLEGGSEALTWRRADLVCTLLDRYLALYYGSPDKEVPFVDLEVVPRPNPQGLEKMIGFFGIGFRSSPRAGAGSPIFNGTDAVEYASR